MTLFFRFLAHYISFFYITTYARVKLSTSVELAFNLLVISNVTSVFD
jgi:hypothetical protein